MVNMPLQILKMQPRSYLAYQKSRGLNIQVNFQIIKTENKSPGPTDYDKKTFINGTGMYFQSNFKSYPAKTIIGKPRDNDSRNNCKFFYST